MCIIFWFDWVVTLRSTLFTSMSGVTSSLLLQLLALLWSRPNNNNHSVPYISYLIVSLPQLLILFIFILQFYILKGSLQEYLKCVLYDNDLASCVPRSLVPGVTTFSNEMFLLLPALLMRSGYCVELSTSSSSCSSMTLHWRRYGVSLAGLRMRVSLCRTPSTRSQSSSQRSSDQGGEDRTSSWAMSPTSAQTVTPARDWKCTRS